jgi:hypothetical protein
MKVSIKIIIVYAIIIITEVNYSSINIIKAQNGINLSQNENDFINNNDSLDTLITEDIIIGVNWHIGTFEACTHSLYLSGNIFNDSLMQCTEKHYKYYSPSLFFFDTVLSFSEMSNKGFMTLNRIRCDYYCYDKNEGILNTYSDNMPFLKNIYKNIPPILQERIPDPFMDYLHPNIRSQDCYNYFNRVVIDTLSNYYKLPRSHDWDNPDEPYFRAISKVFYLVLFKCRLTYYLNCSTDMPIPNLELDLSSPNPDKRSLCSFKRVPVPFIMNIENIEPYNIR